MYNQIACLADSVSEQQGKGARGFTLKSRPSATDAADFHILNVTVLKSLRFVE
jgi:hypothetical protein